jgi:hypothetical protein
LKRAIDRYGQGAFIVEVLAKASNPDDLNRLETAWIIALNSINKRLGYNLNTGGDSKIPSEETRGRMSASRKAFLATLPDDAKAAMIAKGAETRTGWVPSADTRELWSKQRKGRRWTETAKVTLSANTKGKPKSLTTREKMTQAMLLRCAKEREAGGRVVTTATREKMAASQKARFQREREIEISTSQVPVSLAA